MRITPFLAAVLTLFTTAACVSAPADDDGDRLRIVAGSEQQAVLDTLVRPWCERHDYTCEITVQGSVDQARLFAAGSTDFDAYWFASSVFQQVGDPDGRLRQVKPMFLTPVVFAAWRSEMAALKLGTSATMGEILAAAEARGTKVWVSNPTQSNSGATVLFGVLTELAGNGPGQALTAAQLDTPAVADGIAGFVTAMGQTPPSTGTLMEQCVARPRECTALFTYEDLVIERNRELVAAGREPLLVTYPRDALAVSDAPLGLAPGAGTGAQRIFTELQDFLLTDPAAQAKLIELGRRPVTGNGLALTGADPAVFNPDWGIRATLTEQAIRFPAAGVIQTVLDRYQTRYRRPVDVFYCLDGSGSMTTNGGWDGIRAAAVQIFDPVQARLNLLLTHPRDRTTVAVFSDRVIGGPWTVDGSGVGGFTGQIDDLRPGGGTRMYECLARAAAETEKSDKKRLVVLMTDGVSDDRGRAEALAALNDTPVIAIAFGDDVDERQLREVAAATGGAFVRQDDLVAALRQAAGYR